MKKLLTIAACLTTTALLNAQTTIFVKPDGTGDGTSWANACNLETAVARSLSGAETTEIWVQKGTYNPSKMLVIPDFVKIYGGFSGTETTLLQRNFSVNPTIIDGQQKIGSIFRLENSVEINGFIIQNGNANGKPHKNGGGIWADENCVIKNCIITNNVASLNGGGVYANGDVKIINSTIENNMASGSGKNIFGNCLMIKTSGNNIVPNDIAGCNPGIPYFGEISFKSSTVWTISGNGIEQEWSDVVMAEGCEKVHFQGGVSGNYYADCRDNSTYGHLFSWCAVARFAHIFCPAPWHVPAKDDFMNLDKALGGTGVNSYTNAAIRDNYINSWGGACGGYCTSDGTLSDQGFHTYYWSQTECSSSGGYRLLLLSNGLIYPQGEHAKYYGFSLRCVR